MHPKVSWRESPRMPMILARRRIFLLALAVSAVFLYYTLFNPSQETLFSSFGGHTFRPGDSPWVQRPQHFPVTSFRQLPKGRPLALPKIQHDFEIESATAKALRELRLKAVRKSFAHAWQGYRKHAWLKDELTPLSGGSHDSFGHWAATLVDSLDSLWIMGFREEFDEAIAAIAEIDFESSTAEVISVFETTIRYLGGLLSAYDLSGNRLLLKKALQLGEMLYTAFDTPNRMPVPYWNWKNAQDDGPQDTSYNAVSADIGSLTLEFTRLSQISGEPKYFDAVQRISDAFAMQQKNTSIPGLWPTIVNGRNLDFASGNSFTLGALADSLYEYLPKMYLLLGGLLPDYGMMYESFIEPAKEYLFYRPMNPGNQKMLLSGSVNAYQDRPFLESSAQHLSCFVGGMVGIGAKTFNRTKDLEVAEQLAEGCVWAYESLPSGIMPEIIQVVPCPADGDCTYSTEAWHHGVLSRGGLTPNITAESLIEERRLSPGISEITDPKYILRPEAIESVFILYRITGDKKWQDKAWKMFTAIENATRTDIAHAALQDVSLQKPVKVDSMESFWTAETLKYFYLTFSKPEIISLDEWVLNTEAHPFRRPRRGRWSWWR